MPEQPTTHLDYAKEAEAAQRADAWPQAAALWLRASETCSDVDLALGYVRSADACNHRHAIDSKLEKIAKNVLKVPRSSTATAMGSTSTSFRSGRSSWPCGPRTRPAGRPRSNAFVSLFPRGAM